MEKVNTSDGGTLSRPHPGKNLIAVNFFQDRGLPPRSANTTVRVSVHDNDDLTPKFTKGVYRTRINEFYPITVSTAKRHHRTIPIPSKLQKFTNLAN
jgi:hypothetical protein